MHIPTFASRLLSLKLTGHRFGCGSYPTTMSSGRILSLPYFWTVYLILYQTILLFHLCLGSSLVSLFYTWQHVRFMRFYFTDVNLSIISYSWFSAFWFYSCGPRSLRIPLPIYKSPPLKGHICCSFLKLIKASDPLCNTNISEQIIAVAQGYFSPQNQGILKCSNKKPLRNTKLVRLWSLVFSLSAFSRYPLFSPPFLLCGCVYYLLHFLVVLFAFLLSSIWLTWLQHRFYLSKEPWTYIIVSF